MNNKLIKFLLLKKDILMEKEYQVEDALIQQYFPMDKVTEGMLQIYQEILGLSFEEVLSDTQLSLITLLLSF